MSRSTVEVTEVRSVRSFCRICTAICGIVVDVAGKVDPTIRRGAVSVPHGHHGANVNALTDKDDIDPVTGMVRYSGVPVIVEPVRP